MKIGILTHHYVKNFGAFMQAKALSSVISEQYPDAEVEFIDYRIKAHERANAIHFLGFKPKRGDTILGYIEKIKLFFSHCATEKSLPCSAKVNSVEDINALGYDLIVVGSDEVWNFNDVAYSPIKFGMGLTSPCITYSASVGGSTAEDKNIPDEVKSGIKLFKKIAVRDAKSEELVQKLTDKKTVRTLDPVFIYDYKLKISNKVKKIVSESPYILIYDCKLSSAHIEELKKYSLANNCRIIGAGEYRRWYSTVKTTNITPYEWAYLFKNALAVVTGTFHGASFAIKYGIPFVAYLTEQNRVNKVGSLLDEFGLKDRIINDSNKITDLLFKSIDYSAVDEVLQKRKKSSIAFLCECIDEVTKND